MSDIEETALFKKARATETAPDPIYEKRAAQVAFDDVLFPLGMRAPPPEAHESDSRYLARLAEHAAAFGPEDRKHIDRRSLPPAALAEIAREDLAIARVEIEAPNYSLRDGETRIVEKLDRSGRPFIEFFNKEGPRFWMQTFMDPVVRQVSGGSNGIATEDRSGGYYDFGKVAPELREVARRQQYADSAEAKIIGAYRAVGQEVPPDILRKMVGGG